MQATRWDGEDLRGIPEFLVGCKLGQCSLSVKSNTRTLIIDSDFGTYNADIGDYICRSMQGGILILNEGQVLAEWEKEEDQTSD